MKLVNFSVTNFRSITKAHRVSISDTTILIGKNNEGKSNVLKALDIAMSTFQEHALDERSASRLRSRYTGASRDSYYWDRDFPISLQARKSGTQSIFKLDFELDNEEIDEFKAEIKSNLNGTLPIEIKLGKDNRPTIKVSKRGKGGKTLTAKSGRIAEFVAKKIAFNYIPAVRTDQEAIEVIRKMLSQELRVLEVDEDYLNALSVIKGLQQPILDSLGEKIKAPLVEFLPNIKSVKIEIPETRRLSALRREFEVIIDDGTPTNIEFKGDGVKSLAALGLLKSRCIKSGASIIAIEEPESHLHPAAIHQLNEVILSMAESSQVIITTHNPLFVDRQNIRSNIVIDCGKASPARNIKEIRDLLGIKASDNLVNANYALVVEGEEDVKSLRAILPLLSRKLGEAIKNHILIIEPVGGAGNLSYKLSLLNNSLCISHVLLDNDDAGRQSFQKASDDGLLTIQGCTMINCRGMRNSEFEDCLEPSVYRNAFLENFGVDIDSPRFRGNCKWSDRVKRVFEDQGKLWGKNVETSVKYQVGESVTKNANRALSEDKRNSIDALVDALERMVR